MGELSQREAFGRALAEYGEKNPRIMVLDADTASSTFSNIFAKKFPERFLNIGIAEPCLVDVAVGLSLGGYIPFANAFAALLSLRAMEQIRTCMAYAHTNVKLASSYAGLSDFKDGPTHHAILDIAMMRALPGMAVVTPADAVEISAWVPVIAEYDGPVYLRINRSATQPVHEKQPVVTLGKGEILRNGKDITIIACGAMAGRSLQAAENLGRAGIDTRVINLSSIKPLDKDIILQSAEETAGIVTAEEHSVIGGLGAAVSELLSEELPTRVIKVGINDTFARTAPDPESLMDAFGLSVGHIEAAALRIVEKEMAGGK